MAGIENRGISFVPFTRKSLLTSKTRILKENARRKEMERRRAEWKAFHGTDYKKKVLEPRKDLEEGCRLPESLAVAFDNDLVRTPLEEIDNFYNNEKTFVIINKDKEIFRFNSDQAIGILNPVNPIRQTALSILTYRFFAALMLAVVAIHAYIMLMPESPVTQFTEMFFTGIFTLELVIKILARGFVSGKFTYLRDPWNWLDFILVGIAFLTIDGTFGRLASFKALRTLRLLRIRLPGLTAVVAAIFKSMKNLRIVAILTFLFLFVLAVLGLQIYMGILTQKCVKQPPEFIPEFDSDFDNWYSTHNSNTTNWLKDSKGSLGSQYKLCGHANATKECPQDYNCVSGYGTNPDHDYTSFDNVGWAFLSTFRLAMQDYWEALYRQIMVTAGPWHVVFFLIVLFFGSCYLLSLIVSTVIMSLKEVDDDILKRQIGNIAKSQSATGSGIKGPDSENLRYIDESPGTSLPDEKKIGPGSEIDSQPTSTTYMFNQNTITSDGVGVGVAAAGAGAEPEREGWCSRFANIMCVWDCGFPWKNTQNFISAIVSNPFFELFIAITIIVNAFFMALDHYGLERNDLLMRTLKRGNQVFTIIFFVEAALKLFAMSPKYYFQVKWNRFDFIVAVIPVVEWFFEDANLPGISALRSFRLLRIIRLAKYWPPALLEVISRTGGALGYLLLASVVITFSLALMGTRLYSWNYYNNRKRFPSGEMPRWNFNDFWHSWMIIFRATCGEWIETMWDCLYVGDASCIPFFGTVFVIGNLVFLPLYIAIVLRGTYEVTGLYENPVEPSKIQQALQQICHCLKWATCSNKVDHSSARAGAGAADQQMKDLKKSSHSLDGEMKMDYRKVKIEEETGSQESLRSEKSKDSGGVRGPCRLKVYRVIESKFFDALIILMILISCVALALEDSHLKKGSALETTLYVLDKYFLFFFLLEAFVKMIGLGLKKYFTSGWCRFELLIVVVTTINAIYNIVLPGSPGTFQAMRSLRALRFLMFFSRLAAMKNILSTIASVILPILNVLPGILFLWLFFAIAGIQLFNGLFFKCLDSEGNRPDYRQIMDRWNCESHNYTWVNSHMNFDHVGKSFLSLFQVSTFKGWISIMNDAIDSRQLDQQPVDETNFVMYTFFVLFIVCVGFLTRSLIMSIVIMKYLNSVEETVEMEYEKAIEAVRTRQPLKTISPPTWRAMAVMYDVVTHWKFEAVFLLILLLNILFMSMDHFQQAPIWDNILTYVSVLFTAIFAAEALIKIFALRCHYFLVPWNVFDFIVAVLSVLSLILSDLIEKYFFSPILLRVIRIARIGRICRPVKCACVKRLRTLLRILTQAFPSLLAIMTILFLLMYVYSIFGMSYFQHVQLIGGLDETLNFKTFGQAMSTMFVISTGAGWDGVMTGLIGDADDCERPDPEFDKPGNCGHPTVGITFTVSYVIICLYIIASMILAVILGYYSKTLVDGPTDDDFDAYHDTWTQFTRQNGSDTGSDFIRLDQLPEFLDALDSDSILRMQKPNKFKIIALDIPICKGDKVHKADILEALLQYFFVNRRNLVAPRTMKREDRGTDYEPISSTRFRNREESNARTIQKCWRQHKGLGPREEQEESTEASQIDSVEVAPPVENSSAVEI